MATKRTTPAERKRSRERELNGYARVPTPARRRTVPPQASGIEITDAAFVRVARDAGFESVQGRPGPIDWKARAEELHMTEKELRSLVIGKVRKRA